MIPVPPSAYAGTDMTEAALAVEKVGELDRVRIRERALERFSTGRMVDEYEALYRGLVDERG